MKYKSTRSRGVDIKPRKYTPPETMSKSVCLSWSEPTMHCYFMDGVCRDCKFDKLTGSSKCIAKQVVAMALEKNGIPSRKDLKEFTSVTTLDLCGDEWTIRKVRQSMEKK